MYSDRSSKSTDVTERSSLLGSKHSEKSQPLVSNYDEVRITVGSPRQKCRSLFTTFVIIIVACVPALLVGCTLGFPSAALLDLRENESRMKYKFNTVMSDIFGVRLIPRVYIIKREG